MSMWRYGMTLGLLAGLGACSALTSNNHPIPGPGAMAPPAAASGMVKQAKLHDEGYDKRGAPDGV
ncbi:MAG: hypothetical protein ABSC06_14405 [Rhodopila sp.]|jgi:hypothetical protein